MCNLKYSVYNLIFIIYYHTIRYIYHILSHYLLFNNPLKNNKIWQNWKFYYKI